MKSVRKVALDNESGSVIIN